jgi:hypothetical protein
VPLADVAGSQAVILAAVGGLVLLIVIGGVVKGGGKGCGWIIALIIAAVVGYLLISAEVFRLP